jgi:flagellar export protein FliJ
MKKFCFPLEKLRSWRRTEFEVEQAKLEHMLVEQELLGQQQRELAGAQQRERSAVISAGGAAAQEIAALALFLQHAQNEQRRIRQSQNEIAKSINGQRGAVLEARRRLEILNRYRERKHHEWQIESDRQQEELVAELVIGRWKRAASQG